jgi:hypothetical protein
VNTQLDFSITTGIIRYGIRWREKLTGRRPTPNAVVLFLLWAYKR